MKFSAFGWGVFKAFFRATLVLPLGRVLKKGDVMRKIIFMVVAFALGVSASLAWAHGGGCRKNSPPGQCCHKNHKTGDVHCH